MGRKSLLATFVLPFKMTVLPFKMTVLPFKMTNPPHGVDGTCVDSRRAHFIPIRAADGTCLA
jgi:hypothetical protein